MMERYSSFFRGMGSLLNIYPASRVHEVGQDILSRSNAEALASDWQQVGDDMRRAMGQFVEENGHVEGLQQIAPQ